MIIQLYFKGHKLKIRGVDYEITSIHKNNLREFIIYQCIAIKRPSLRTFLYKSEVEKYSKL